MKLIATAIKSWKCVEHVHRIRNEESIRIGYVDSGHLSKQLLKSKRKQTKVIAKEPDIAPIRLGFGIKFDRSAFILVL